MKGRSGRKQRIYTIPKSKRAKTKQTGKRSIEKVFTEALVAFSFFPQSTVTTVSRSHRRPRLPPSSLEPAPISGKRSDGRVLRKPFKISKMIAGVGFEGGDKNEKNPKNGRREIGQSVAWLEQGCHVTDTCLHAQNLSNISISQTSMGMRWCLICDFDSESEAGQRQNR